MPKFLAVCTFLIRVELIIIQLVRSDLKYIDLSLKEFLGMNLQMFDYFILLEPIKVHLLKKEKHYYNATHLLQSQTFL